MPELLSIGVVGKDRVCAQLVIAALREPGLYVDTEEADRVDLVGPAFAWCHPVLYPRLLMVKALRPALTRGHRPRCTATCDHAATRARRVSDPVSAEWCGVMPRWPIKTPAVPRAACCHSSLPQRRGEGGISSNCYKNIT